MFLQACPSRFAITNIVVAFVVLAASVTAALANEGGNTALTIYSTAAPGGISPELYRPDSRNQYQHLTVPGYAVIEQERSIDLGIPRSVIRFSDVAAEIDPTTVRFSSLTDPGGTSVLEQNYQFDLVSSSKLMERYIDHQITLEQVRGDVIESITGKLLSTAGGLVLQRDDGSVNVVNGYSNVIFPELPGGLITKPTLVWDVATSKPGTHNTRVTYQTGGITWWADYNVVFAEGQDANSGLLDVGAWVSIINQSGAGYEDAKLKLVAGDVQRAPTPQPRASKMLRATYEMDAMAGQAGFEEKSFFEYHLYTLGRPTTLPDNSTKQIELFPAATGVPCEKVLVYYGLGRNFGFYGNPMTDRNFGNQSNKKVDIYLRFENSEEAGMGMPLPAGKIRVSKLDPADNTLEFIGEDVIDHTPRKEKVLIKLGSAFDVVGERKQIDFKVDTHRDWMDETIEVKIRNRKKEAVKVIVKENLYRWVNWEIVEKTHRFEKVDSRTVQFPIDVKPDEEVTVQYKVHYSW